MATQSLIRPTSFPSLFEDYFRPWNELMETSDLWKKVATVPAVNISETETSFKVSLAAPGLKKQDFSINIGNNMLTIGAEKKESKEEKDEKTTRKEYNYSSFSRSFSLPELVKQEAIEAKYEDGVLNILLPKRDDAKKTAATKQIAVK